MGNDTDRLQQMEDNWNAGDTLFQALGLQQDTMRKLAKFRAQDEYETAIEYYLDEGYPKEMAEEYATATLGGAEIDQYKCPSYADDNGDIQDCLCGKCA